jgi:chemotaxis protein CheD
MKHSNIHDLHLAAGEFHFGSGGTRIHTILGTCVSIVLWHPAKRMGGMCHFLLPTRPANSGGGAGVPGMYADEAMGAFAESLRTSETLPGEYVVKIAGGGNMFPDQLLDTSCRDGACTDTRRAGCQGIGCKNIRAARSLLAAAGYMVTAEDVGGHGSRLVIFELWSGHTWMKRGGPMAAIPRVAA